jgi:hypothetical protein
LKPHAKRLVLLDSKEQVLGASFLLLNEKVRSGQLMDITVFTVLVGEHIISDSLVRAIKMSKPNPLDLPSVEQDASSEEHIEHFSGLDFNPGRIFEEACLTKFGAES